MSLWQHYKGARYMIVGLGTYESTMEPVVIYRSLDTAKVWVRPLKEWEEEVYNAKGQRVPRFIKSEPENVNAPG